MPARRIYMDNAATTPLDPRVLEAMLPYFRESYGNPSSRTHPFGWEAEEAVEQAREEAAALIGAQASEITFTSGATESNNLALKGTLSSWLPGGHLVTTAMEHSAILDPAAGLERRGLRVTRLRPDRDGRIDPAQVAAAISEETRLVSIMLANNETGILQDLEAIGRVCAERGVFLHTDATQAAGKVGLRVRDLGVHLLSFSAHKMYGPKGAGALYVRRKTNRLRLTPQIEGGGQERGLRSGTLNVPALVGFGTACALASAGMASDAARVGRLRDHLESAILERVPEARRNGAAQPRVPGISSLSFAPISGEVLLLALSGVALSAGSACASGSLEPSHVLLSFGLPEAVARNSLRFSLGRFNTAEEVESVIQDVCAAATQARDGTDASIRMNTSRRTPGSGGTNVSRDMNPLPGRIEHERAGNGSEGIEG